MEVLQKGFSLSVDQKGPLDLKFLWIPWRLGNYLSEFIYNGKCWFTDLQTLISLSFRKRSFYLLSSHPVMPYDLILQCPPWAEAEVVILVLRFPKGKKKIGKPQIPTVQHYILAPPQSDSSFASCFGAKLTNDISPHQAKRIDTVSSKGLIWSFSHQCRDKN